VRAARARSLPVCTHLIVGLPGEGPEHSRVTLDRVLAEGVEGLKLHPLHVVKGTVLGAQFRRGEYRPWTLAEYVETAADLIVRTPEPVVYHRVTGTSPAELLLAPAWCAKKWAVLNGIERELVHRGVAQGGRPIAPAVAAPRAAAGR
jgi:radical SAM protein (TIGR01212 family)